MKQKYFALFIFFSGLLENVIAQKQDKFLIKVGATIPTKTAIFGCEQRISKLFSLDVSGQIENFEYDKSLYFQGVWKNYYAQIRDKKTINENGKISTLKDTTYFSGSSHPILGNQAWTPVQIIPIQISLRKHFFELKQYSIRFCGQTGFEFGFFKYLENKFNEKIITDKQTIHLTEFPTLITDFQYVTRYEQVRESHYRNLFLPRLLFSTVINWTIFKHLLLEVKSGFGIQIKKEHLEKLPNKLRTPHLQTSINLGYSF
jgi:hypothetical protein